jgi:hemoglobin
MNDITTETDVQLLVERFYGKLVSDPVVGHFFEGLDLEHHLPRIRAFWEMVLLNKPGYSTNVTDVHLRLNQRIPMKKEHFDRWLQLFRETLSEHFAGPNADEAYLRALSIAAVMLVKVQR